MFYLILKLLLAINIVSCSKYEDYQRKDDKIVLDPIELIDLVREEERQTENYHEQSQKIAKYTKISSPIKQDATVIDAEALRARKVWSRWSKWSECSVTCGSGVITRSRACVAGRYAPGEHEEQRRPCDRAPCPSHTDDLQILEDSHESE